MHYLEEALFKAIKAKNPGHIKRLIETIHESSQTNHPEKASLFARNDEDQSFLHYALELNEYDAFNILLPYYHADQYYTHPNDFFDETIYSLERDILLWSDKKKRSLFALAIQQQRLDYAEKILQHYQFYPSSVLSHDAWLTADEQGVTPLHLAAKQGYDILSWLLNNIDKAKFDLTTYINCKDKNDKTPLHFACGALRYLNILPLLERGADTSCKDNNQQSFINHLEKEPGLLTIAELKNEELKGKILQATQLELILSPDNQFLTNLRQELTQVPNIRCEPNPTLERHYRQIVGSIDYLKKSKQQISLSLDQFKKSNEALPFWRILMVVGSMCLATLPGYPLFWFFFCGIYMTVKELSMGMFLAMPLIATTPAGIAFIAILSLIALASFITFVIAIHKTEHFHQQKCLAISEIATEAEKILTKLEEIRNNNPAELPVDTQIIGELAEKVKLLKNYDYNQKDDKDKKAQQAIEDLEELVKTIKKAVETKGKPILINETRNTSQINEQLSLDEKSEKENSEVVIPIDDHDSLLADAPKISSLPSLLSMKRNDSFNCNMDEEDIPLLDMSTSSSLMVRK